MTTIDEKYEPCLALNGQICKRCGKVIAYGLFSVIRHEEDHPIFTDEEPDFMDFNELLNGIEKD